MGWYRPSPPLGLVAAVLRLSSATGPSGIAGARVDLEPSRLVHHGRGRPCRKKARERRPSLAQARTHDAGGAVAHRRPPGRVCRRDPAGAELIAPPHRCGYLAVSPRPEVGAAGPCAPPERVKAGFVESLSDERAFKSCASRCVACRGVRLVPFQLVERNHFVREVLGPARPRPWGALRAVWSLPTNVGRSADVAVGRTASCSPCATDPKVRRANLPQRRAREA